MNQLPASGRVLGPTGRGSWAAQAVCRCWGMVGIWAGFGSCACGLRGLASQTGALSASVAPGLNTVSSGIHGLCHGSVSLSALAFHQVCALLQ